MVLVNVIGRDGQGLGTQVFSRVPAVGERIRILPRRRQEEGVEGTVRQVTHVARAPSRGWSGSPMPSPPAWLGPFARSGPFPADFFGPTYDGAEADVEIDLDPSAKKDPEEQQGRTS